MLTALFAAVLTSCKKDKDKTPAWFTEAQTKFGNGRFVPDVEDLLPGSLLGTNTSTAARTSPESRSSATSSAKAADDYETIKFADLKGNYWDGMQHTLNSVDEFKERMERFKDNALTYFEQVAPTTMGEWTDNVKYEENANGDKFIYAVSPFGEWQIKLSMYSDGANEVYFSLQEEGGYFNRQEYSYLKDDKFTYIYCGFENEIPTGASMFLFNTENGKKKGRSVGFSPYVSETRLGLSAFEGDDKNASAHNFSLVNANTSSERKGQSVMAVVNGLPVSFVVSWEYGDIFDYPQDVRAFANIDEIYFKYVEDYFDFPVGQYPGGLRMGDVCGLKLTDGTLIEESDDLLYDLARFTPALSSEIVKDPETGAWGEFRNGGFSCAYNMFWTADDPTAAPSAAIPAWLKTKGLKFIDGFDELYLGLRAESEVYFDNFYISDFPPLANTQINYANGQNIMNILLDYVQTHAGGFDTFVSLDR